MKFLRFICAFSPQREKKPFHVHLDEILKPLNAANYNAYALMKISLNVKDINNSDFRDSID